MYLIRKYSALIFFTLLLLSIGSHLVAQENVEPTYHIKATLKPYKNEYAYLAYYFADGKQYLLDSALINNKSVVEFIGTKELKRGIYLIILPQKKGFVDMIVDQTTHFSVALDTTDIANTLRFVNSNENRLFYIYQNMLNAFYKEYNQRTQDSASKEELEIFARIMERKAQNLKDSVKRAMPDALISKLFSLFDAGNIPESMLNASNLEKYHYAKRHYWDNISFADQRLLYTPILENKVNNYLDNMVTQLPDSIWKEVQVILDHIDRQDSLTFSYYLNKMLSKYGSSERMGYDGIYVNVFEKYVLDQKPSWIKQDSYDKMKRKYYMTIGNIIGRVAQNIELLDTANRTFYLYNIPAEYTVLCFWDPTCSHCTQTIPKIDSMYQATWKDKDIKVIGIYVDGGLESWKLFLRNHVLSGWLHGYQSEEIKDKMYEKNIPSMHQAYNIISTPLLYLLDNKKEIIAKNVDHYTLDKIIEFRRKQQQATPK